MRSQIQSACPCQVQIEIWMLYSWLCYLINLLDLQLPRKALIYFNATNVPMIKDGIYFSEPKSLDMAFFLPKKTHKFLHQWFFELISNIKKPELILKK